MKRKLVAVLALGVVTSLGASVAMAQQSTSPSFDAGLKVNFPLYFFSYKEGSGGTPGGSNWGGISDPSRLPVLVGYPYPPRPMNMQASAQFAYSWPNKAATTVDLGYRVVRKADLKKTLDNLPYNQVTLVHAFVFKTDVPDVATYAVNTGADFSIQDAGNGAAKVTLRIPAEDEAK